MSSQVTSRGLSNGWIVSSTDGPDVKPPSHVLMTGGKLFVPDKDIPLLHKSIVEDARHGITNSIVEILTSPKFIMYLDLDFKKGIERSTWIDADFHDIMQVIYTAALPVTQGHTMHVAEMAEALMLLKPPAYSEICDEFPSVNGIQKEGTYPGYHIVWQGCAVNMTEALTIRKFIIGALKDQYSLEDGWDWNEIVDEGVYKGSGRAGIRMLFQNKSVRIGGTSAFSDLGRVYDYRGIYDPLKGYVWNTKAIYEEDALAAMTVRCPTVFAMEAGEDTGAAAMVSRGSKRSRVQQTKTKIPMTDPRIAITHEFLMEHYFKGMTDVEVTEMEPFRNGYRVKTNCKMCPNYEAVHSGATQYFTISKTGGVVQRCFCRCSHRTCATWKGKTVRSKDLSLDMKKLLFPDAALDRQSMASDFSAAADLRNADAVQATIGHVVEAGAAEVAQFKDSEF